MIRIVIAEDHQSLIDGLELQFENDDNIQVVGSANDGEMLLEIVEKKKPDVVITDIRMPKIDGIAATKLIKKDYPEIQILAFTMFDQDEAVSQMLGAGATGYVLKSSSLNEVRTAIETVAKGEAYYDPNININAEADDKSKQEKGKLTKRQKEILEFIAQGKTSREIADQLFTSVYTIETHRKNMIKILGLHGNGELLRYAIEKKYDFG
ncbi:response regulator transcription factor [Fulvivirga sp.]|uniref:response regulator transcription factor n=1 Tax=Fulvivirga sp. TaxID=1931237 RepID=UPI0032EAE1E6